MEWQLEEAERSKSLRRLKEMNFLVAFFDLYFFIGICKFFSKLSCELKPEGLHNQIRAFLCLLHPEGTLGNVGQLCYIAFTC